VNESAVTGTPLPGWAGQLKARYEAGVAGVFLLHGNVRDYYGYEGRYYPLDGFLSRALLGGSGPRSRLVVTYSLSGGLRGATPEMEADLERLLSVYRGIHRASAAGPVPSVALRSVTDPAEAFAFLDNLITTHDHLAIVIEDAEPLIPAGDFGYMNPASSRVMLTLRRWAGDARLERKDCIVLVVVENLSDIHPKLLAASGRLESVSVPLPNETERRAYIRDFLTRQPWPEAPADTDAGRLAAVTGGLTLEQIDDILRTARYRGESLTFESVLRRKTELVEKSAGDLVTVVQGGPGLEAVGGMEKQKALLADIVKEIRAGNSRRVPKGIYVQGAPGTGKTFLMTCFGNSSGLPSVVLKSFYNKYVGGTESNVERLLGILEAMGPLLLILDEYDQSFGRRGTGDEGDSGVRQRVWAMFSAFLSRPDLQGKVIPVALLNRSDLVDAASKRAGRFDLRMPLFLPDRDEQLAILQRAFRNNDIATDIPDWTAVLDRLAGKSYSPADLNKVAQLSDERAASQKRKRVKAEDILWVMDDYIPSQEEDPETVEYMELLAARSSSSKSLLPDRYRRMLEDGTLDNRLNELRMLLQMRGRL
jgi:SpoVK/Ycf46/Vps4 family AAA+-type ATPase